MKREDCHLLAVVVVVDVVANLRVGYNRLWKSRGAGLEKKMFE